VYGLPPKAIWMRVGNGPTAAAAALLRARVADVPVFAADPALALLDKRRSSLRWGRFVTHRFQRQVANLPHDGHGFTGFPDGKRKTDIPAR
jgi:hypothetical protein